MVSECVISVSGMAVKGSQSQSVEVCEWGDVSDSSASTICAVRMQSRQEMIPQQLSAPWVLGHTHQLGLVMLTFRALMGRGLRASTPISVVRALRSGYADGDGCASCGGADSPAAGAGPKRRRAPRGTRASMSMVVSKKFWPRTIVGASDLLRCGLPHCGQGEYRYFQEQS